VTEVRFREMSDDDEPWQKLIELLAMIRSTMDALPVPICDGSRLADDRAATKGFLLDLPTICEHYLFGSEDFLGGLLALMQPRPNTLQLPRFALYPLIRGVIESSGQTAWVLGPAADQSARFRRLLQLQMDELRHDRKYIKAHTHPRDDDPPEIRSFTNKMRRTEVGKLDIRRKGLLDAAAHLNIAQAEIEDGVSGGYAALIRETVDEQAVDTHWHGRQGAGTWMFISGLSHPSMSRAWSASIHEPGEVGPDDIMPVRFEANPLIVYDGLRFAVALHARAIRLWKAAASAPETGDDGG
jgi:hypothetical protein